MNVMQIRTSIVFATLVFATLLTETSSISAQEQESPPLKEATPPIVENAVPMVAQSARPIVSRFNAYYRSLQSMSCTAEIELFLNGDPLQNKVFMNARAVRPSKVEILAYDEVGAFPTSQFISNGTELFEYSIKRNSYMISTASPGFDSLHERAMNRSAPNIPVEVFLSLLSNEPMENLLKLSVEPGLIRLEGTEEINGTPCHVLVVNTKGSKAWVAADGAPRLMRYVNSQVVAKPRYLPRGVIARGLDAAVSFKSWVDQSSSSEWKWSIPNSAKRMATMHENAAGPGPEQGYSSMEMGDSADEPNGRAGSVGNRLQRAGDSTASIGKGLPVGTRAPDVTLDHIDGGTTSLDAVRNSRPAVLLFWVPGGKFTQSSMSRVITAARALSDQVEVIPIAVGGDAKLVRLFTAKYPRFSGSYLDIGGKVSTAFEVGSQAGIVLIEADGKIWRNLLGPRPNLNVRIRSHVNAMLAQSSKESTTKNEGGSSTDQDSAPPSEGDAASSESPDGPSSQSPVID